MAGMLGGLPPGLRGMLAAQQMREQSNQNQLGQIGGILSIQNARQQMQDNAELKPLQRMQLQLAIQKAQQQQAALNRIGGGQPAQDSGYSPAVRGVFGMPEGQPAQSSSPSDADYVALLTSGVDPKTVNALRDIQMPKMDVNRGYAYDARRVGPGFLPGMEISQTGQAVGITPSLGGGLPTVSALPGSVNAFRTFTGAQEDERAARDLVIVPSTGPGSPPRYASRASLLPGQPQPAPVNPVMDGRPAAEQEALRQVMEAERTGRPATVPVPPIGGGGMGAIPSSRVVGAPNAAGMSPADTASQAAAAAAQSRTATERADAGVKFETSILDNGQKARTNLTQLQILAPNLEKLPTGPLYPTLASAGAYLSQFGIDVGQLSRDLGPAQATDAILKKLAIAGRDTSGGGGMPGAMSDADRKFLVDSIPGLNKLPDGNRRLLTMMMSIEQRKVEEASIVQKMQADGKNSNEIRSALGQFAAQRPLFQQ